MDRAGAGSWRGRPILAVLLRLSFVLTPLAVALVAADAGSGLGLVSGLAMPLRWAVLAAVSTLVMVATHRAMAGAVPLAALLELSVAFPGRVPSRLAVARDARNPARLRAVVQRARGSRAGVDLADADAARDILALVAALRLHDSRTRGHSERVRVLVDLIGEQMHLLPRDREKLRWAALLHDVGKLSVPASVLTRRDRLDAGDWDRIREHPDAGARLTAPLQAWLEGWGGAVADHHERYDGTGYPRGLIGSQINLGGRIIAVADAFEVMTAGRSYRKAVSRPEALRELTRCSGKQFDPTVVRAMLSVSAPRLGWAMGPLAGLCSGPFALATPASTVVVLQTGAAAVTAFGMALPAQPHSAPESAGVAGTAHVVTAIPHHEVARAPAGRSSGASAWPVPSSTGRSLPPEPAAPSGPQLPRPTATPTPSPLADTGSPDPRQPGRGRQQKNKHHGHGKQGGNKGGNKDGNKDGNKEGGKKGGMDGKRAGTTPGIGADGVTQPMKQKKRTDVDAKRTTKSGSKRARKHGGRAAG